MKRERAEERFEKSPVAQQIAKTPKRKFMLVKALGKIKREFFKIRPLCFLFATKLVLFFGLADRPKSFYTCCGD